MILKITEQELRDLVSQIYYLEPMDSGHKRDRMIEHFVERFRKLSQEQPRESVVEEMSEDCLDVVGRW